MVLDDKAKMLIEILPYIEKHSGKTIQGHHSYSVSKYPHLADKGEIIYTATFNEHFNGWLGGNFRNSLPGEPIKTIIDF